MSTSVFPDVLKKAVVIPLHKKGDTLSLGNYRPISLLSVFSKLFEKIIKKRLLSFLAKFNFFSDSQFGFRVGKSTEDALLELTNKIIFSLNNNESAAVNFIDVTKAFDTVDHNLLLLKLDKAGIRGIANEWFLSYLSDRQQAVKIGNCIGEFRKIKCGVPQGSVLGPILFLIYINSFFELKLDGHSVGFADDVGMVYSSRDSDTNVQKINNDLRILRRWFDLHYMVLSSKTNILYIKLSGVVSNPTDVVYHSSDCLNNSVTCSDYCKVLDVVESFKYLGVTIDKRFSFKSHVKSLQNYLLACNRKLYLLRDICPEPVLRSVYFGIVQSKLQYGLTCWGGIYYSNLKALIVAQNFIMRTICCKPRLTSTLPLFRNLNILPLRHLYVYKVLKIFFLRSGHRNLKVTNYTLRNANYVNCPPPRKEHFKHFFSSVAPKIYNQLSDSLKQIPVYLTFLKGVKSWLMEVNDIETLFHTLK